jgi:hypothetical protein
MSDEEKVFNKASWGSGNPEILNTLKRLKKVLTQAEQHVLKDFKHRIKELGDQVAKESGKHE